MERLIAPPLVNLSLLAANAIVLAIVQAFL